MRLLNLSLILVLVCGLAKAQDAKLIDPSGSTAPTGAIGTASMPELTPIQKMKGMIKTEVNKAIDGKPYPSVQEWRPLTKKEKFHVFLHSTYSPWTFANAAIDVTADRARGVKLDPGYETGWRGLGQRYGVELATSETDVFFERFLFPSLLKQDPRYFRNPDLPLFHRVLYSMSRVFFTRSDNGGETINGSRILGSAASRAIADVYVPGAEQGIRPIASCVTFTMARDAGMNLLHEFWPDLRHKFLHR